MHVFHFLLLTGRARHILVRMANGHQSEHTYHVASQRRHRRDCQCLRCARERAEILEIRGRAFKEFAKGIGFLLPALLTLVSTPSWEWCEAPMAPLLLR